MRRRAVLAGAASLVASRALAIPGLSPMPGLLAGGVSYSAWNPADAGNQFTFSVANRKWTIASASITQIVRGTVPRSSGKKYFEITLGSAADASIGVATADASLGLALGVDQYGWGYETATGSVGNNAASVASGGAALTTNDVMGVAVDLDAHKLYFSKNGTYQFSGNPAAGTGGISIAAGTFFPSSGPAGAAVNATLNVGNAAFANSPPSGYSAWG